MSLLGLRDARDTVRDIQPKEMRKTILTSLFLWPAAFGVMGVAVLASGSSVPLAALLLGGSATILASFIPLGVLGSFGILEAGWVLGFRMTGVGVDHAVAGALIYSSLTLLCAVVLALPSFTRRK